jgi:hypothetical protein
VAERMDENWIIHQAKCEGGKDGGVAMITAFFDFNVLFEI